MNRDSDSTPWDRANRAVRASRSAWRRLGTVSSDSPSVEVGELLLIPEPGHQSLDEALFAATKVDSEEVDLRRVALCSGSSPPSNARASALGPIQLGALMGAHLSALIGAVRLGRIEDVSNLVEDVSNPSDAAGGPRDPLQPLLPASPPRFRSKPDDGSTPSLARAVGASSGRRKSRARPRRWAWGGALAAAAGVAAISLVVPIGPRSADTVVGPGARPGARYKGVAVGPELRVLAATGDGFRPVDGTLTSRTEVAIDIVAAQGAFLSVWLRQDGRPPELLARGRVTAGHEGTVARVGGQLRIVPKAGRHKTALLRFRDVRHVELVALATDRPADREAGPATDAEPAVTRRAFEVRP